MDVSEERLVTNVRTLWHNWASVFVGKENNCIQFKNSYCLWIFQIRNYNVSPLVNGFESNLEGRKQWYCFVTSAPTHPLSDPRSMQWLPIFQCQRDQTVLTSKGTVSSSNRFQVYPSRQSEIQTVMIPVSLYASGWVSEATDLTTAIPLCRTGYGRNALEDLCVLCMKWKIGRLYLSVWSHISWKLFVLFRLNLFPRYRKKTVRRIYSFGGERHFLACDAV
jgi:hypothetical protein